MGQKLAFLVFVGHGLYDAKHGNILTNGLMLLKECRVDLFVESPLDVPQSDLAIP